MFNSKYNKFLTVLLIIIILAIVGILIFLGVRYYKKVTTAMEKDGIIQQFDEQFGKEDNDSKDNNNTDNEKNENVTLNVNENEISEGYSGGGSGGGQRLQFKGYGVLGKIKIPATGIEELVLDKVTTSSIESAVAVLYGPGLNEVGNTVIVGHNYRDGSLFSNNKLLKEGDKIIISDEKGRQVVYTITKKYITTAQDFAYASRDTAGRREISLSTCTDDSNSRLIIWASAD